MGIIWGRFSVLFYVWLLGLISLVLAIYFSLFFWVPALITASLGLVGIYDRLQTKRAVLQLSAFRQTSIYDGSNPSGVETIFLGVDKMSFPIRAIKDQWFINAPKVACR